MDYLTVTPFAKYLLPFKIEEDLMAWLPGSDPRLFALCIPITVK